MKTSVALVKLIVFMVVTSLLTFVLAATIGNFSFGKQTHYTADFTDATGLLAGNEVRIAGVKVGKVDGLSRATAVVEGKPTVVARVKFSLEEGRTISGTSVVRMRYRNLVGERYIAITSAPGTSAEQDPDTTIDAKRTINALDLTVLFNGFKPLFQALDAKAINDVAFEIVQTLQGEGGTVESLLQRTASLTNTIADKDAVIGRVIDNLTTVLATVDDRDGQLNELITQVQRLSKGFAQDRQVIGQSLVGINALTSATADLIKEVRPPLRSDIVQLQKLAATLDDNKEIVGATIARLPTKLDRIVSTATDGSWFNFYLCGASLTGLDALLPGAPAQPVTLVNQAARCDTEPPAGADK